MFGATLNLHGYTCQTTVIFWKLKDGSVVKSLASSSCFSYRSVSQNSINALSKIVFKSRPTTRFFVKKLKISRSLAQHVVQYFIRKMALF